MKDFRNSAKQIEQMYNDLEAKDKTTMQDFKKTAKEIEQMCNDLEAKERAKGYMSLKNGYKDKDAHYNNDNGSLYLFAQQHELNAYEFDIIKRVVRCRKKGQFVDDLAKSIRVIELYLKEHKL